MRRLASLAALLHSACSTRLTMNAASTLTLNDGTLHPVIGARASLPHITIHVHRLTGQTLLDRRLWHLQSWRDSGQRKQCCRHRRAAATHGCGQPGGLCQAGDRVRLPLLGLRRVLRQRGSRRRRDQGEWRPARPALPGIQGVDDDDPRWPGGGSGAAREDSRCTANGLHRPVCVPPHGQRSPPGGLGSTCGSRGRLLRPTDAQTASTGRCRASTWRPICSLRRRKRRGRSPQPSRTPQPSGTPKRRGARAHASARAARAPWNPDTARGRPCVADPLARALQLRSRGFY
jgi:hypothetical protein